MECRNYWKLKTFPGKKIVRTGFQAFSGKQDDNREFLRTKNRYMTGNHDEKGDNREFSEITF